MSARETDDEAGYSGTEVPRRLLEYLAEGLVDEPDEVLVTEVETDSGTIVLELSVAEGDYGRVIGRAGRTAPGRCLRISVTNGASGCTAM